MSLAARMGFTNIRWCRRARFCDNIFAVGDYVVKELRFLRKEFANVHIDLAYNGVPARTLTIEEKMREPAEAAAVLRDAAGI